MFFMPRGAIAFSNIPLHTVLSTNDQVCNVTMVLLTLAFPMRSNAIHRRAEYRRRPELASNLGSRGPGSCDRGRSGCCSRRRRRFRHVHHHKTVRQNRARPTAFGSIKKKQRRTLLTHRNTERKLYGYRSLSSRTLGRSLHRQV